MKPLSGMWGGTVDRGKMVRLLGSIEGLLEVPDHKLKVR